MRKIVFALCVIGVIVIFSSVFLGRLWTKMFISTADTKDNPPLQQSIALSDRLKSGKQFSIVLLGYGGGKHEGAYLTDSILDVVIDPARKWISLISIPRDIWLQFPDSFQIGDHWKINTAYDIGLNDKDFPGKPKQFQGQLGGMNLVKYAVSQVTGQPVDRAVLIDFDGFKQGIDMLGGIDVKIDKTFDDYEYPIDGKEDDPCGKSKQELDSLQGIELADPQTIFPCRYEHLHFDKGIAHLDGTAALKLARSRHSAQDGTDFSRSARQRNILIAVRKKLLAPMALTQVIPLMNLISDHLKTDLTLPEIGTFIMHAQEMKTYRIQDIALTNDNMLQDSSDPDAGYTLIPQAGVDQWSDVHAWVAEQIEGRKP